MSADDRDKGAGSASSPGEMAGTLDDLPIDLAAIQARFDPIKIGSVVAGKYRVEAEIGRGGMGTVYKATQLSMDRPIALKTLRGELLCEEIPVKRFYREAKSASRLNHPNIVRVFDFGVDEELAVPYIVMEYLEGPTLTDLVMDAPLGERRATSLLAQVAKALVDAHSHGVVHRDLKPDNIIVVPLPDGDEHIKVLDFGLAKVWQGGENTTAVTKTGALTGTPAYMSPEQIVGESVDFRADLYALGCVLFYLLVGHPPFEGHDALGVVVKQVNEPAPPLPDVLADGSAPSAGVRGLYQRLVAKDAQERPMTTTSVAKVLGRIGRAEVPGLETLDDPSFGAQAGIDGPRASHGQVPTGMGKRPSGLGLPKPSGPKPWLPWALVAGAVIAGSVALAITMGGPGDPVATATSSEAIANLDTTTQTKKKETRKRAAAKKTASKAPLSTENAKALVAELVAATGTEEVGKKESTKEPPPKESAKLKEARVAVLVKSDPPGAQIYEEDATLGRTPMQVILRPGSESRSFVLKTNGYMPREFTIDANSPDELIISLTRRPKKRPPRKKQPTKKKAKPIPVW